MPRARRRLSAFVLPLRDVIVYPDVVVPLLIGREKSVYGLEAAMKKSKEIFLVSQKKVTEAFPKPQELYKVGTVATIVQLLKLPDGTIKTVVEGAFRAEVKKYVDEETCLKASIYPIYEEDDLLQEEEAEQEQIFVLMRALNTRVSDYARLSSHIQPEIVSSLLSISTPGRFADMLTMHLPAKLKDKQAVLEQVSIRKRLETVMLILEKEIDLLEVEKRIQGRVRKQMEKTQRKYYLDEQVKAIQEELSGLEPGTQSRSNEIDELKKKILKAGMGKEAKEKALYEWEKLRFMPAVSSEATVVRMYIDWLLKLPWKSHFKISHDLHKARNVLDQDHYDLDEVKKRILEHIAVQSRSGQVRGNIICFVGPPGVGKTSLGESIARSVGRKFVRISLGGVSDEAEIRGHRRTYVGALPGKVVQQIAKAGSLNLLILFDEIDKMGKDFRGDPASALLEVLDPEQNARFNDNYLEVPCDLSKVMFIMTANSLNIPPALLDRMEVIRLSGYTEFEKMNIATKYLIPKQVKLNALQPGEISISEKAVMDIIRYYTREAGVRELEREIAKICRKVVTEIVSKSRDQTQASKKVRKKRMIGQRNLNRYLGVRRYRYGLVDEAPRVGQVCGLAWTEVGGELLTIEVVVTPGKGKSVYTGCLGDVMQESIKAAMTVVRGLVKQLNLKSDFYQKMDIHVHVPEGATPKDGPSAGIGMCTALVSAVTKVPVRADVAMTGEITLRGEVLPIGGLKEKLLAAARAGVKQVIIPEANQKDLQEVPKEVISKLDIKPVKWIKDVLKLALVKNLIDDSKT